MKKVVVLSRRSMLAGTGALVFSFSSRSRLAAQEAAQGAQQSGAARALPGSLKTSPFLDSWIRIDANGSISVFTGKAELGQGIKTALLQVAAEELDVAPPSLTIITALQNLVAEYDCVMVDLHSTEQTADLEASMVFISYAIVVVEAGRTSSESLSATLRLVPRDKVAALVLNKI